MVPSRTVQTRRRARRGTVLPYTVVVMLAMLAVCSLAVDYGHVQAVKTDLQRAADAAARGCLAIYTSTNYNASTAQYFGAVHPHRALQPGRLRVGRPADRDDPVGHVE